MYRAHHPNDPGMHMTDNSDSHTRVTYRDNPGFIQRIQSSFGATLLGIGLVIFAFPVLYWNEGRAVETALSLDEGLKAVVTLPSISEIQSEYQDKLVYLTGSLKTDQVLNDGDYGVGVKAVKLKREVEMYQWAEHKSTKEFNEGGKTRVETTYTYSKEWHSSVKNSDQFDDPSSHRNPSSMPDISAYIKVADPVYVGAFKLSKGLIGKVEEFHRLFPKEIPSGKKAVLQDGIFYHSRDPFNPKKDKGIIPQRTPYLHQWFEMGNLHTKVGDFRVTFSYAGLSGNSGLGEPQTVSIVARQYGSQLTHYHTSTGHSLELLYSGEMSAKEIFDAEHAANTAMTWILRGVGWLMLFLGFMLSTSILTTLVSWLPIVRELVGLGITLICFCLATSLSLVTIAIGWISHRPLLGIALLAAAAVPIFLSRVGKEKKKESKL